MKEYTECRIRWCDDLTEYDVLISSANDDPDNPDENDNDIFYYGMSRDDLLNAMDNGTVVDDEWAVVAVY